MTFIPNQQQNTGAFVPTTNVWDVARLQEMDVSSPEFKELLVRLYQNINNIALVLNIKDSAYYMEQEFVNGQVYFNPLSSNTNEQRMVFRKVINFGALPNAGLKSVAHGIDISVLIGPNYSFTRIYATATDPVAFLYIPIPFVSTIPGNEIQIDVDSVNVNITTTIDYSSFTICYVVLEYLKN